MRGLGGIVDRVSVRRGIYQDSVTLMLLSRDAGGLRGVIAANVFVASPLNLELLARQGFVLEDEAGPNDLVIAVRAKDEPSAAAAWELIDLRLQGNADIAAREDTLVPPASIRSAVRRMPGSNVLFVSVPSRHASYEIAEGIEAGLHVFCFSSGVRVEDEVWLKRRAAERGLLLMGPDCGTAIIDGIGLGFFNQARRGPVGIVGASGTGIQELTCLLDRAGVGISQAIGVGSRDLSREVNAVMTLHALSLLLDDDDTEVVVVLSKPPDPGVAARVARGARRAEKPVILAYLGAPSSGRTGYPGGEVVPTVEEAAIRAARLVGASVSLPEVAISKRSPGFVRGLFGGGSLSYEAMLGLSGTVGPVLSNNPIRPEWSLPDIWKSTGHTFVDFGSEALTEGRVHPMIDPSLRDERFQQEALDPDVGVVLLDVVLGHGGHPDPVAALAPLIERSLSARPSGLSVIVVLCGAEGDPQGLAEQTVRLRRSGAIVTPSAAQAARLALEALGQAEGA